MPIESTPGRLWTPLDLDPIADWPAILGELVNQLGSRSPRMFTGQVNITPSAADTWTARTIGWDLSAFDADATKWGGVRVFTTVDAALTTGGAATNIQAMGTLVAGGAGNPASSVRIACRRSSTAVTSIVYQIVQVPKAYDKVTA